jgi:hypothetical protein
VDMGCLAAIARVEKEPIRACSEDGRHTNRIAPAFGLGLAEMQRSGNERGLLASSFTDRQRQRFRKPSPKRCNFVIGRPLDIPSPPVRIGASTAAAAGSRRARSARRGRAPSHTAAPPGCEGGSRQDQQRKEEWMAPPDSHLALAAARGHGSAF